MAAAAGAAVPGTRPSPGSPSRPGMSALAEELAAAVGAVAAPLRQGRTSCKPGSRVRYAICTFLAAYKTTLGASAYLSENIGTLSQRRSDG